MPSLAPSARHGQRIDPEHLYEGRASCRRAQMTNRHDASGPESTRRNGLSIDRIASAPFPYRMVAASVGDAVAWTYNERGARNVWVAEPSSSGAWHARSVTAYTGDDGIDIADLRLSRDRRLLVHTRGSDHGGQGSVDSLSLT